jgi:hypothetical protein
MRYSLIFLAVTSLSYANLAKADNSNLNFFPLNPRVTLSGGYGNANSEGDLDGMVPLFGSAQGDVYTDVEGQSGADKSWFGSIGLGGRQAFNDNFILGAYGFVDRTQTVSPFGNDANKWIVFNPGIEAMTPTWDARINGYFPVGPNERVVSGDFFGDQVGKAKYVTFQGHQQFDGLYDEVQGIGTGTDADVGYTFKPFRDLRIHGGGYYFQMPNTTNMKGGEAGAEMPVNDYVSLAVDDSYDNIQKNSTMLSLKLTLGNIHKTEIGPVTERLLDPIHRHLGTLYTSSSIPSVSKMTFSGRKGVFERGNIWFFSQNGDSDFNSSLGDSNCTAEHPCNGSSFNQTNANAINNIAPGANFYFNPGNYSLNSLSTNAIPSSSFQLYKGQSMYGRTIDYKLPASQSTGDPIFYGSIVPQGNNLLDSFEMLNNNGSANVAIDIKNNANNITMNNLQIGELNSQYGYSFPISVNNSQNVLLENSTINAFTFGNSNINQTIAFGISNNSGSVTTLDNNIFNVKAIGGQFADADGLFQNSTATLIADKNIFNVMASNGVDGVHVAGIYGGNGVIFSENNIFNITANGGISSAVQGIFNALATTTLNNNTFNVGMGEAQFNNEAGILYSGGTLTANGNKFNVTAGNATNINVYGVFNSGSLQDPNIVGENNIFNLTAPSLNNIHSGSNLISGSDNTFICNGDSLNC